MTISRGPILPAALLARLSHGDLPEHLGKALPLITVDHQGRPHPMLLSYLEVRALDAGSLALVVAAGSRSARNLTDRGRASLLLVEPDLVFYVKASVVDGPLDVDEQPELALFVLAVEEVLEDSATGREAGTQIVSGIRYGPPPALHEPWVGAIRAALASPRPRA
jgi:Pyridoxamine 5'-phosphate oxidase